MGCQLGKVKAGSIKNGCYSPLPIFLNFFFFFDCTAQQSDLSSLTRDWTSSSCDGSRVLTTGPPENSPTPFLRASQVVLVVKKPARLSRNVRRLKRHRLDPWVGNMPWRRACQPTPVFLPGEYHGQMGLEGYSPYGRTELDTTEATQHTRTPF